MGFFPCSLLIDHSLCMTSPGSLSSWEQGAGGGGLVGKVHGIIREGLDRSAVSGSGVGKLALEEVEV